MGCQSPIAPPNGWLAPSGPRQGFDNGRASGGLHAFCGTWARYDRERFLRRTGPTAEGVARELAKHLIEECQRMKIDKIGLEVHRNKIATAFLGFGGPAPGRCFLFRKKLDIGDDY